MYISLKLLFYFHLVVFLLFFAFSFDVNVGDDVIMSDDGTCRLHHCLLEFISFSDTVQRASSSHQKRSLNTFLKGYLSSCLQTSLWTSPFLFFFHISYDARDSNRRSTRMLALNSIHIISEHVHCEWSNYSIEREKKTNVYLWHFIHFRIDNVISLPFLRVFAFNSKAFQHRFLLHDLKYIYFYRFAGHAFILSCIHVWLFSRLHSSFFPYFEDHLYGFIMMLITYAAAVAVWTCVCVCGGLRDGDSYLQHFFRFDLFKKQRSFFFFTRWSMTRFPPPLLQSFLSLSKIKLKNCLFSDARCRLH